MKLLRNLFFLLSISAFLFSCIDDEVDITGYGDAFILVETIGQDTLKGLGLHAFSYSEFSSVNVYHKDKPAATYALQSYLGYKQDFIWSAPQNQFSTNLPEAGDYVFNATYTDGQKLVFYDKLTADFILPPLIKLCEFVSSDESVDVEWGKVVKADSYNVKLLDLEGKILFVSPVYNSGTTTYSFSKSTQGWQTTTYPAAGQGLTVEVAAYLLEAGSNEGDLQCIAKSRNGIVWGN